MINVVNAEAESKMAVDVASGKDLASALSGRFSDPRQLDAQTLEGVRRRRTWHETSSWLPITPTAADAYGSQFPGTHS